MNKQQNNFDEKDYQFAYIPIGEELLELLIDLNLSENMDSKDYIDQREVAKQLSKKGFRIFDKETKKRTPVGTPVKKKDFTLL